MLEQSAVAVGFFDGLHIGHRAVIGSAAASGLPAAVCTFPLTDPPAGHDAPWLLTPQERTKLLRTWGVGEIAEWGYSEIGGLSPEAFFDRLCRAFRPGLICCGYNYRFGCRAAGNVETLRRLCAERGIRLQVSDPVLLDGEPVSSTRIRSLLEDGRPEEVARCLGRPFSFMLPVETGRRLGRTLHFPTINQPFPDRLIRPRFGVYVSGVRLHGRLLRGVTNIGVKPTVGSEHLLAETHIFGCGEELYGETLEVELYGFLRPEQRFGSVDELKDAISRDAERARAYRLPAP